MKIFTTVATMISLAAGSSAMAQNRVQDNFHTRSVELCFDSWQQVDDYVFSQTDQRILFTAVGLVTLLQGRGIEVDETVVITVYVDQETGNFTLTKTFEDEVTCLITEGVGFEPYVE